jgi:hypothetical protein
MTITWQLSDHVTKQCNKTLLRVATPVTEFVSVFNYDEILRKLNSLSSGGVELLSSGMEFMPAPDLVEGTDSNALLKCIVGKAYQREYQYLLNTHERLNALLYHFITRYRTSCFLFVGRTS